MNFMIPEESMLKNSTLAFSNIIIILSDTAKFIKWLREKHNITKIKNIFEGFKFTLLITIGCLTNSFISSDPFRLGEDRTYRIATSYGISLEDIPNTCEKTIFRKKLWNIVDMVRGLKDWDSFTEKSNEINKLVAFSSALLDRATLLDDNNEKEIIIKYITADRLLVYFHDTKRGYPLALTDLNTSIYELYKRPFYLEKVIRGYTLTLEYIWFKLLKQDFMNYSIKHLPDILKLNKEELEKIRDPVLEELELFLGSDSSIDEDLSKEIKLYEQNRTKSLREELRNEYFEERSILKNQEKYSKILSAQKAWFVLDRFFDLVKKEIIEPLEDQMEIRSSLDPFFYFKSTDYNVINKYFPDEIEQPSYFYKEDHESIKKRMDYILLWHKIAVLDAQAVFTFNGVYAFVASLLGIIKLRRMDRSNERVLVRIFKHPTLEDTHYYSFGILMEPWYGLHGTPGWIIFSFCATDFSSSGYRLRSFVYEFLEDFKAENLIEIEEFKIQKDLFEEYLKEKSVSSVFDITIILDSMARFASKGVRELKEEYDNVISSFKGKFFEFIVHKWLNQNKSYIKTFCDIYLSDEQIDCLCFSKDNITEVYECKLDLHDDEIPRIAHQITKKSLAVKKAYPDQQVVPFLILLKSVSESRKKEFLDSQIRVLDNFEKIIKEDNCFYKTDKGLMHFLNFSGIHDFVAEDFH